MRRLLPAFLLLMTSSALARPLVLAGPMPATVDPLETAADYYFTRHEFRLALDLWGQVLRRQPDHLLAVLRVAELALVFEGRPATTQAIVTFLSTDRAPEARRAAEEKLAQLQTTFLTDEGQSAFYQALVPLSRGDCTTAAPLLAQAASLEKGNVRVLREKARCERQLGAADAGYGTAQLSLDLNPFSPETLDVVGEGNVYLRAPAKTVTLFHRPGITARSYRQRTAYGVALAETGAGDAAIAVLQPLVQDKGRSPHPVVAWALGTTLATRPDRHGESLGFLETFLSTAERPEAALIDGWDPYRTPERLEAARRLVATLKGG